MRNMHLTTKLWLTDWAMSILDVIAGVYLGTWYGSTPRHDDDMFRVCLFLLCSSVVKLLRDRLLTPVLARVPRPRAAAAVFEDVANRVLTPEQGAKELLEGAE